MGEWKGLVEGNGRGVRAVIPTLLQIEGSSARDTRRAVGALRVTDKTTCQKVSLRSVYEGGSMR